jgi:hypothetical protein
MIDLKSSIICTSRLNCKDCRNKEGGRYWRLTLAQVYRLPEDKVDFECPHGKPWGFSDIAKRTKPKHDFADGGDDGKSNKDRHYSLPPEAREKLREIFLQFRTACYQQRSLHGCTCELQTMGGCGLKTALKNKGQLPCVRNHFPTVEIDESFRQQLNECKEKD